MSKELVENLYEQMLNTKDLVAAQIIKNMYENQDYKNPMITEFFDKKCTELKINECSKILNKENIGLITDCQIDIMSVDDRVFPVLSMNDKDKNYIGVGLNIGAFNQLIKQVQGAKAGLSILQHIGLK